MRQMSSTRPRRYAVIGSGAAGCYMAEALLRGDPEARVDVIERLPTPFGLVRYGVAPDHQGTKAVTRTLGRILENERIGFFGASTSAGTCRWMNCAGNTTPPCWPRA